jgi:hypothetical protein
MHFKRQAMDAVFPQVNFAEEWPNSVVSGRLCLFDCFGPEDLPPQNPDYRVR